MLLQSLSCRVAEDASLKVAAEVSKVKALLDEGSLRREAEAMAEEWAPRPLSPALVAQRAGWVYLRSAFARRVVG